MAAEVSGVNVKKTKVVIYVISGVFTGIAAIVLASRTVSGQPAVGEGYQMNAITAAIIGVTMYYVWMIRHLDGAILGVLTMA
ncbi:MAG: hypothetical protein SAMD01599839_12360 [Rectinema sp.]